MKLHLVKNWKAVAVVLLVVSIVTVAQFQHRDGNKVSAVTESNSVDQTFSDARHLGRRAEQESNSEINSEDELTNGKGNKLSSLGASWPGSSFPESLAEQKPVPELAADRNLDGVILTSGEMREVNLEQRIVLEGEAIGVGNKGATSLRLRYGESSDTEKNRSCFIGGSWSLPKLSAEAKESGRFYWVRIECTRVECRDIDFAEFCIDDVQVLGASVVTAAEVDQSMKRRRASLIP